MKKWKRRNITLLFMLFALSITSVSFSVWVNTEAAQGNVDINVGVGEAHDNGSFFKIVPGTMKGIKYCIDGFIDDKNNINFFEATIGIEMHVNATNIKKYYDDLTKKDFFFICKLAYGKNNKLTTNFINENVIFNCYAGGNLHPTTKLNSSTSFNANKKEVIGDSGNLSSYFGLSDFYFKVEFTFNIKKTISIYDDAGHFLGYNYNWFEEYLCNNQDESKTLKNVELNLLLNCGTYS